MLICCEPYKLINLSTDNVFTQSSNQTIKQSKLPLLSK